MSRIIWGRHGLSQRVIPANSLDSVELVRLLKLRRERGYGAVKLGYLAKVQAHPNTIHRLLERHGLIALGKLHRRPRFQDTVHMHAKNATTLGFLQMDVKHVTPELSGLPWTAYEYAVMDIYSRYKDAIILNQIDAHGAVVALLEILCTETRAHSPLHPQKQPQRERRH